MGISLEAGARTERAASESAGSNARLDALFRPIDPASLAFFRIGFGLLMFWEVLRYFHYGWIDRYWIDPAVNFGYPGFEWVRPWPGMGMRIHFVVLGILALCIAAGCFYRIAAPLFALGFTYAFLLEQTRYLNHFYLIALLSFLLCFVPAHRAWSIDALRDPALRDGTVAVWGLWLLRAQITIVYLFGGIAKLNVDWLGGEPMRMWLAARTDTPLIGGSFTEEWVVYLFSYGALFIDLVIPFLLLIRPTRIAAFAVVVGFHLLNDQLFFIGIFPWMMIVATLLFFPPDWPRRLLRRARPAHTRSGRSAPPYAAWVAAALALYLALQVLIPLRHFLYPGNESWTEEGHRFAWHMKLRDKSTQARFFATDPRTGQTWELDASDFAEEWQFDKIIDRPHLLPPFARHVRDVLGRQGYGNLLIHAEIMSSLNGRKSQLLVNPDVNLAAVKSGLPPNPWILPLKD
ncbi:MAG: HTTM domain-containing protein [Actinomycetota bacterium]